MPNINSLNPGFSASQYMVQTEPAKWSISCKYPAKGTAEAHFFLRGFISMQSSISPSDQEVIPLENGGQDAVIPFYSHTHRFSAYMISGDDDTTEVDFTSSASVNDLALVRGERFIRAVRSKTENTDENWELIFRYNNYIESVSPSPRAILAGDVATNKEYVYRMIGKIQDISMTADSVNASIRVQVDFTFVEDTEV